ncbi:sulfatase-like hydrolase/transferase [Pontiellaceae bacterium B12227]|nr:sulfatase-like hydrolase/transferase [Pontiellaceae bacterium B12227]
MDKNKLILVLSALCMTSLSMAGERKPNILFIFADDMSYETIGAHGLLDIDTPHLDTLVENGASFTHAYNMGAWGGAVCVASRKMLNTGLFVWRSQNADLKQFVAEGKMWSQRMSAAGYRTYMSGKWHVPTSAPGIFDVAQHIRAGMPKQVPSGYNRPKDEADYEQGWKPWDTKHGGYWQGGKHWSEVLADDSVEFLEQAAKDEQPFFMYLAFNAPHDPRQAPKEYIDRYPLDRIKVPATMLPEYPYAEAACGKGLRDEKLMPYPRTEYSVKVNRQEYFALITHMDDQIGKIFQALEKTGQADNTYIVFTADHGLAVGHHGFVGKQNMYDHSMRPPFLLSGPGVKAGAKIDVPIYLQDVVPTALDWAGGGTDAVDFKSLLPLLQGETAHYDAIYGAYMGRQRMITKGGWKLIAYPNIGIKRLYNLQKDPMEMTDLAANPEYAARLKQLTAMLETEMDAQNDPMTSLAAADFPVAKSKKKAKH